jgi:uncharacterized protein YbaR (Trm112 family)
MDSQLLKILRCPQNQGPLVEADAVLIEQVNTAIRDGRVSNQSGHRLSEPIAGGLVRATGELLYPIVDGIPLLLKDEAIALDQFRTSSSAS